MVRVSSSHSENYISLEIEDRVNYNNLIRVDIDLKEFALLITGMGSIEGKLRMIMDEEALTYLNTRKVTAYVDCDKVESMNKEDQRAAVLQDFKLHHQANGWRLFSDGTNSQQPRKHHQYIVYKYINEDING